MECHSADRGGREFTNSHGAGTFVCPSKYRSSTDTCEVGERCVFMPTISCLVQILTMIVRLYMIYIYMSN